MSDLNTIMLPLLLKQGHSECGGEKFNKPLPCCVQTCAGTLAFHQKEKKEIFKGKGNHALYFILLLLLL